MMFYEKRLPYYLLLTSNNAHNRQQSDNRGEATRLSAARDFSTEIAKEVAKWETHTLHYNIKMFADMNTLLFFLIFPNWHLFWRGAGSRAHVRVQCAICCYLYVIKREREDVQRLICYFCEICSGGVKKQNIIVLSSQNVFAVVFGDFFSHQLLENQPRYSISNGSWIRIFIVRCDVSSWHAGNGLIFLWNRK